DRWIGFGGLWFFLTLLPVSQLIPHQELVAEHFLYLPSVGICLIVALLIERGLALPRAGWAVGAIFVLALLLLGARTVLRNRDWKDELTLWTKAVQAAPHSYWAHQRLGDAYKSLGRYAEAIQEYKAVQALIPGFATEYIAIGDCYRRLGEYEAAADQFQKALMISPNSVAGRLGLAHAYLAMGLLGKAREVRQPIAPFLSKAARDFRETGNARMAEGLAAEAVTAYRNGLEFDPFDPSLHIGLARAYTVLGLDREAAEAYRKARQLDPTYDDAMDRSFELRREAAAGAGPAR
ncbi:MAG: tetratricopeptide repeat protein, partial [Candidatus Methylomirabilis sp.]